MLNRVTILQSSSNSLTFLTKALVFIKTPELYIQSNVYSRVNIVALFAVHLVHVNLS